jgi:methylmalonyl-CoA mutase C-terminal domain/subunit
MERKVRVLIAKAGLDGHETGAKLIARALRDAGMEVIYTGGRQTPEMIVTSAIQEDVDVIGLSILSGAHRELCARVVDLLRKEAADRIALIVGGIIPRQDVPILTDMGVCGVFGPATTTTSVVDHINRVVLERRGAGERG